MSFLLNAIYASFLIIGSPWLLWRYFRLGKNRRGWGQKLFGLVPRRKSGQPCIWFHAVSVGEVNLLAPVLKRIRQQYPALELVISTTTESGYDLAQKKYSDICVFFFPFDFSWAVRNAVQRIRPSLIVLTELELWPNFIRVVDQSSVADQLPDGLRMEHRLTRYRANRTARGNFGNRRRSTGIPIALINGRLSESSFRGYQRIGKFLFDSFRRPRLLMVQNETYAQRFRKLGIDENRIVVTGSVKFDGVQTDRSNATTTGLKRLAGIEDGMFVFLAGSTQFEEDVIAATAFQKLSAQYPQARLILAPRHPERCQQLVRTLNERGLNSRLRSGLLPGERTKWSDARQVLIIDVIGELGAWWGAANVAFVGGSMGRRGGQNMIEPAAYGIPVSFGPHTESFQEIVDQLLEADAAKVVCNDRELEDFMLQTRENPGWAGEIGARGRNVVLKHDGAADRSVSLIISLLSEFGVRLENAEKNGSHAA